MMKKKVLTILLTALLFLSAVTLGLSAVFRVDLLTVEAPTVSEAGRTQVSQVQKELLELYKNDSIFSVKQSKSDALLEKYPYLRITGFSKAYPNKLVVTLVEDAETYAVETENGEYYILNAEGVVIERRASAQNRFDGGENVIVKGLQVQGTKGEALQGAHVSALTSLCRAMDKALGGIRRNVLSVAVEDTVETVYWVAMREGVRVRITQPTEWTEKKAEKIAEKYRALTDKQRMTGYLLVVGDGEEITVGYVEKIS